MPPEQSALAVSDLRFSYGARDVLQGLSFEVAAGEVFGLLGPNGCGKSTALSILSGMRKAKAGEIRLHGATVDPRSIAYRANIGVVFQSPSLDAALTARENLALHARFYGLRTGYGKERIAVMLEAFGLADRGDDLVSSFSGGMKRRLDLARALLHKPQLLLLDEPTVGLDEASFRSAWQRLLAMRAELGLTILLSTHRPDEAERCDRLAVMHAGRAAQVETPEVLRRQSSDDIIELSGVNLAALVDEIRDRFDVSIRSVGDHISIECERGHELIPRLVEAFPDGQIQSVILRRPSLADVFYKITGSALDVEVAA